MGATALSPLAQQIREIVAQYSRLPDAILNAQCKNLGTTPDALTRAQIPQLAERIGTAVGMFTNPQKGRQAEQEILQLR